MSLFEYEAVDSFGEAVTGTMDEPSGRRVTEILQERGLQVSSVKRVGVQRMFARRGRLGWEDLHLFNEELLAIARSGVPMSPALRAFAVEARNKRLKPILESIQKDLEQGSSLSDAFEKHTGSFSPVYVSLIRAGERSGNLVGVLGLLSTYTSRGIDMRHTLQMALAYPILVLTCTLGVLAFIMTKVVPVFAEIFTDFGAGLPGPTQFVVDVGAFLDAHWFSALTTTALILCMIVVTWRLVVRGESRSHLTDLIKQRMPFYGNLFRATSMARFCRSLGLLLQANIPVSESLDLAAAASGNEALRMAARKTALGVNAGERIADAFSHTGYFDHSFCWLFAMGEERGEADKTVLGLAEFYEREVASLDRVIGTLLGPVLIILVGGIIAFVVVSLYLPIFSLGDAISGG